VPLTRGKCQIIKASGLLKNDENHLEKLAFPMDFHSFSPGCNSIRVGGKAANQKPVRIRSQRFRRKKVVLLNYQTSSIGVQRLMTSGAGFGAAEAPRHPRNSIYGGKH